MSTDPQVTRGPRSRGVTAAGPNHELRSIVEHTGIAPDTVRGLARYLEGERIVRVSVNRPDLRFLLPVGMADRLTPAGITRARRRE